MKVLATGLTAVITIAGAVFVSCLVSTVLGALVGWIVGLVFSDVVLGFLGRVGMNVDGISLWEVGAALGFIGSFFRSRIQGKSDG